MNDPVECRSSVHSKVQGISQVNVLRDTEFMKQLENSTFFCLTGAPSLNKKKKDRVEEII